MTTLASTVQAFFTDYLTRQRRASPHTIAAYRDTCKLLLTFASQHAGTPPSSLQIADLLIDLRVSLVESLRFP